jgi:hypothetical protein
MTTRAQHLSELAHDLRPDLHVVSVTNPDPQLATYNVVAEARSTEQARRIVVDLENHLSTDARIGLAVLSAARDTDRSPQIDPEGVAGSLARRALLGGAIGAAVGAILGGLLGWVWSDVGGPIGGALGGAALFAVFGAVWGAFTKMGGSDAYRQTFVEPQVDDVVLITYHTDDRQAAEDVRSRLGQQDGLRLLDVDDT